MSLRWRFEGSRVTKRFGVSGHDQLVLQWLTKIVSNEYDLPSGARHVALTLGVLLCGRYRASHYPSQSEIAEAAGYTENTVQRLIRQIDAASLIYRRPVGVAHGRGWKRTIYRLRIRERPA